jgi:hypothetical protein
VRFFSVSNRFTYIINQNVTHKTAGNKEGDNAVLPAWRDSLYITNFGVTGDPLASFAEVEAQLALVNEWQIALHDITPGGGSYMNEATFNFPYWKVLRRPGHNQKQIRPSPHSPGEPLTWIWRLWAARGWSSMQDVRARDMSPLSVFLVFILLDLPAYRYTFAHQHRFTPDTIAWKKKFIRYWLYFEELCKLIPNIRTYICISLPMPPLQTQFLL